MTRPGPITDDPAPSDNWPAPILYATERIRLWAAYSQPIGPKPIVVVDRGPVVTDADRDAVGRLRAAWLGKP